MLEDVDSDLGDLGAVASDQKGPVTPALLDPRQAQDVERVLDVARLRIGFRRGPGERVDCRLRFAIDSDGNQHGARGRGALMRTEAHEGLGRGQHEDLVCGQDQDGSRGQRLEAVRVESPALDEPFVQEGLGGGGVGEAGGRVVHVSADRVIGEVQGRDGVQGQARQLAAGFEFCLG